MQTVEKVWGMEQIYVATPLYTLKRMVLTPGYRCSIHHHEKKDETFLMERGIMKVMLFFGGLGSTHGLCRVLTPGDTIHIPPGVRHTFLNPYEEEAVFLEVSTHDDPEDSYRVTPSGLIEPSRFP
jgi:mannose-6-phosphate isomerase-like protein (cupin superfamily)